MKAQELTIGAYVSYNGKVVRVWGVDIDGDVLIPHPDADNETTMVRAEDLEPIPMTEQIATEYGFEYFLTKNNHDKILHRPMRAEVLIMEWKTDIWYFNGFRLKYAHEFQMILNLTDRL